MILPLIIASVWAVLATVVCYIQVKKVDALESVTDALVTNMQSVSSIISSSKELLDREDIKVAFSNDDEIGVFFRNLEEIQDTLNNFILPSNAEKSQ